MVYTVFCRETKQQKHHTSIIPYSNVRTLIIHICANSHCLPAPLPAVPGRIIQSKHKTYFSAFSVILFPVLLNNEYSLG